MIHLQQMDGVWDRHWAFTKDDKPCPFVSRPQCPDCSKGAEEVYLLPELIHPFEFPEDKLLEELDESYEYLRQYVCQQATV